MSKFVKLQNKAKNYAIKDKLAGEKPQLAIAKATFTGIQISFPYEWESIQIQSRQKVVTAAYLPTGSPAKRLLA